MRVQAFDKNRRVLWSLLFFFPFLCGGFFEFTSCLYTVGLSVYLILLLRFNKRLTISWGIGAIALTAIPLFYGLSCFWAVDRGMAFLGLIKFLPLAVLPLIVLQLPEGERRKLLSAVPVSGICILMISVVILLFPAARVFVSAAGRLGGLFQYANTFALYLLLGIVVLQLWLPRGWKLLVGTLVLLAGILSTGSRTVFLLTAAALLLLAVWRKPVRWLNIALVAAAVIGGGAYAWLTSDFQTIGRFLTISGGSSTFLGRLLYWQDALSLLGSHPFGLGFGGYSYLVGTVQTGVYNVQFVHNDWLQIALDIGWLAALLLAAAVIHSLFSRSLCRMQKLLLALIGLHCLLDFDLQYLSVTALLPLCLSLGKPRQLHACLPRWSAISGCAAAAALSGYMFLPTSAFYLHQDSSALSMYPSYTAAEERLLKSAPDLQTGDALSSDILSRNAYAPLAYDAQALVCALQRDFDEMCENKERAIACNPYSLLEYVDYANLLQRAADYHISRGVPKRAQTYISRLQDLPGRVDSLRQRTSPLGWAIKDQPMLTLPDETRKMIQSYR